MKNYILYEHISPNGKRYIGITGRDVNSRWQRGSGYKANKYFYNAIQKYGWSNFEHNIIKENLSLEEANKLEREYILKYNTLDPDFGYNHSIGGEKFEGYHLTEEHKRRVSDGTKKAMQDPEIRKKCSKGRLGKPAYNKGKHLSEETKEKIRQANLGSNNPNYGRKRKPLTEEQKQKIREATKKAMSRPDIKEKQLENTRKVNCNRTSYNKGKHLSEETKKRISENTKKAMNDPIIREKFLQANKEAGKRRKEGNRIRKEISNGRK